MELTELVEKPWLKSWPEEIPITLDLPDDYPIYNFLQEAAELSPNNVATVFFDKKMKYGELWEKVLRFANSLHNLGVKKGDRIGIYLPNCPQFVIAFFAINRLGAMMLTIITIILANIILRMIV